jgi:hypothetical protein
LIHSEPRADYPGVVLAIETIIVAQGKQGKVQLIRLFFYRVLGNRSWRK